MDKEQIYYIYLKWTALPASDRKPKTKLEFAAAYNLTATDLLGFEDRETFGEDVLVEMKKWAKRKTPELIHILYDKYAKSKSPNDLKVWMDVIREVKDKGDEPQTVNNIVNIFNPNDDQKRQIAERISRRVASLPPRSEE
jgi:hypothetical protein